MGTPLRGFKKINGGLDMVPGKKGKRIKINNLDSEANPPEDENAALDAVEHNVPSAWQRALEQAEEAEKDILKKRNEELEREKAELQDELSRERAKLQNLRRRADEERSEAHMYGSYDLAFDLLNIMDCFEMGLSCAADV